MRSDHLPDDELIRDLRAKAPLALSLLFDRYGRLVFDVARRILHDDIEAEDVMQDIFLEVYRKADQYDSIRGGVKTWLLQYAYHRAFNRRKYLALRHYYDNPTARSEAELAADQRSWQGLTEYDLRQALNRGLDELNPKERSI